MKLTKKEIEIIITALEVYKSDFILWRDFERKNLEELEIEDLIDKLKI